MPGPASSILQKARPASSKARGLVLAMLHGLGNFWTLAANIYSSTHHYRQGTHFTSNCTKAMLTPLLPDVMKDAGSRLKSCFKQAHKPWWHLTPTRTGEGRPLN